jgi:hypothetical protein
MFLILQSLNHWIMLKYKELKLGSGQSYGRSSEQTAVVAGATNNRARSAGLSLN